MKKVLIVDDEPDILEFLSYNFRKKGYEVYTAQDGILGFHIAQNTNLDLIITDILMPNMNGIIFCRQIKGMERFRELPVIFLSAVTDPSYIENALQSGANYFLPKTIRISTLIDYADDLLKKSPSAEEIIN